MTSMFYRPLPVFFNDNKRVRTDVMSHLRSGIININTTAIQDLWIVTHLRHLHHALYGRRHVQRAMFKDIKSAVSLAGVCASPTKPALAGVKVLPAPTGRKATQSRLAADISAGKASYK